MKTCTICKENKELNNFPRNKNALDGYRNQCKICRNKQAKIRYINKATKKCRGCLKTKKLIYFNEIKNNSYSWTCNTCKNIGLKHWNTAKIKACIICHEILPADEFHIGDGEYDRRGECKECIKKTTDKEKKTKYAKKYLEQNREKIYRYRKEWEKKNKDKVRASQKHYRSKSEYLEKVRKRNNKRYKKDIKYRIICCIRGRLLSAVKQENKGGSAVKELGCSVAELKEYLESKFYNHPETHEPMTWDNHAQEGWHIDHIIPLASFDLTDSEQVKKACHYTNLQPLWAYKNRSKGNKIDY